MNDQEHIINEDSLFIAEPIPLTAYEIGLLSHPTGFIPTEFVPASSTSTDICIPIGCAAANPESERSPVRTARRSLSKTILIVVAYLSQGAIAGYGLWNDYRYYQPLDQRRHLMGNATAPSRNSDRLAARAPKAAVNTDPVESKNELIKWNTETRTPRTPHTPTKTCMDRVMEDGNAFRRAFMTKAACKKEKEAEEKAQQEKEDAKLEAAKLKKEQQAERKEERDFWNNVERANEKELGKKQRKQAEDKEDKSRYQVEDEKNKEFKQIEDEQRKDAERMGREKAKKEAAVSRHQEKEAELKKEQKHAKKEEHVWH